MVLFKKSLFRMVEMQSIHSLGPATVIPDRVIPDSNLVLQVRPDDLMHNWDRCGLTADFIADYYGKQWVCDEKIVINLISTALNELIENAVRFSLKPSSPINVIVQNFSDSLVIEVENYASEEDARSFQNYLDEISSTPIDEVYLNKFKRVSDNTEHAGLGILMILKNYSANLTVKFRDCNCGDRNCSTVTTRIALCLDDAV